ncbi:hypothetical protein FHS83_002815 [Rhizomicrobium palustre]|uniref:Glycoside hydrolase n=1 Tax=Rhizomicrobium palustre TaxID=189966 RepID=A0A846N305_9PROT|nr:glycoside hydrolase family 9 protein [Rhizomicrobium palustre]NIK89497.1 hypothetical protein [Rhizomicrobium palustre]
MKLIRFLAFVLFISPAALAADSLAINGAGYFEKPGLNVMVFDDFYPEGHQGGVSIIQQGVRVAALGDLRLEPAPGQWSPMPAIGAKKIDRKTGTITQSLSYPDPKRIHATDNPIVYPDLDFSYRLRVTALSGDSFKITVDLDKPLPEAWIGKVGFNLELFPGDLFGKPYLMDGLGGIFPRQPNGPITGNKEAKIGAPLASGTSFVVAPDDEARRLKVESKTGPLQLIDGRVTYNNGWFVLRSLIAKGASKGAIEWIVTPHTIPGWKYQPVIQVSQVGYASAQQKRAVIERDPRDTTPGPVVLYRLTESGKEEVQRGTAEQWGKFLRYDYATYDFSKVTQPGMYVLSYGRVLSHPFRIGSDVYDRDVWQPTLEYFLPAQMCHMLVREGYRVWHGLDHQDDALMAPVNHMHFDGYAQGPSTLTSFKPWQHVPGLDEGGWHDAGDYDLRVESQMGTVWALSKMVTEFGLTYDATTIDETAKRTEIHEPDGKNDAQQQIVHGLLSVLGGYHAMGRLYRGIQDIDLEQYTLLGDISTNTDGLVYDAALKPGERTATTSGKKDDRLVFTEDNPDREVEMAAQLAAASVALKNFDAKMSADALDVAKKLDGTSFARAKWLSPRVFMLSELYLATGDKSYLTRLIALKPEIVAHIGQAWALGEVINQIDDAAFKADVAKAVAAYQKDLAAKLAKASPYGVPFDWRIWGVGWQVQEEAVHQYFFRKGWPELTTPDFELNALNYDLGVHPGENTESFASGVGARSATVAYGTNRADWSYIPGGVVSGTALIRPDLPELKVWPFFWQQKEYVMGGGETDFMFLALDARKMFGK